jgi:hypothetical protein
MRERSTILREKNSWKYKNEAKKRKIHTDRQLVDKKTRRES